MLSQLNATLEEENKALVDQVNKLVEQVCNQANNLEDETCSFDAYSSALTRGRTPHMCHKMDNELQNVLCRCHKVSLYFCVLHIRFWLMVNAKETLCEV